MLGESGFTLTHSMKPDSSSAFAPYVPSHLFFINVA